MFENLTFDRKKYDEFPLCQGRFFSASGKGCLITAFMAGFGFTADPFWKNHRFNAAFIGPSGESVDVFPALRAIDDLARKYIDHMNFTQYVRLCFDHDREQEAKDLMNKLIEKLT